MLKAVIITISCWSWIKEWFGTPVIVTTCIAGSPVNVACGSPRSIGRGSCCVSGGSDTLVSGEGSAA